VFEPPPEESGGGFVFGLREYLVQREELSRTGSVERHEARGRIGEAKRLATRVSG
jgi:hypothetical protein